MEAADWECAVCGVRPARLCPGCGGTAWCCTEHERQDRRDAHVPDVCAYQAAVEDYALAAREGRHADVARGAELALAIWERSPRVRDSMRPYPVLRELGFAHRALGQPAVGVAAVRAFITRNVPDGPLALEGAVLVGLEGQLLKDAGKGAEAWPCFHAALPVLFEAVRDPAERCDAPWLPAVLSEMAAAYVSAVPSDVALHILRFVMRACKGRSPDAPGGDEAFVQLAARYAEELGRAGMQPQAAEALLAAEDLYVALPGTGSRQDLSSHLLLLRARAKICRAAGKGDVAVAAWRAIVALAQQGAQLWAQPGFRAAVFAGLAEDEARLGAKHQGAGDEAAGLDALRRARDAARDAIEEDSATAGPATRELLAAVLTRLGDVAGAEVQAAEADAARRGDQGRCVGPGCARATRQDGGPLDMCARCLVVHYCSTECQAADWQPRHRAECRQLRGEREARDAATAAAVEAARVASAMAAAAALGRGE